jgi:capsular polysaccharide export protein
MCPGSGIGHDLTDEQVDDLMEATVSARVGGAYWGEQPALPYMPYTLVRIGDDGARRKLLDTLDTDRTVFASRTVDPWHMVSGAEQLFVDADDELALIAGLAGVPVHCIGEGRFDCLHGPHSDRRVLREAFRAQVVEPFDFVDPFSQDQATLARVIELSSFWRRLVDSNRDIVGALGFAIWKRSTVEPLLWAGSAPVSFMTSPGHVSNGQRLAVWKSRVASDQLVKLGQRGIPSIEVEDGFIRSVGLGADCIPPLSIVADRLGIYFDPSSESELERLLNEGAFPAGLLRRAQQMREVIVESGLSKYETSGSTSARPPFRQGSILVPGQVEDDRSVVCGGGDVTSNLELLRRVRADAPANYIIYKPHPDVEAGHRIGAISDEVCLTLADEIVREVPISALISAVDEVHVNTSLAGFEALLRGKRVTTHGVPFYAGWGLTRDLGAVPARRAARRSLDELVAAALLLYPRYVDPVTGLPCPPEVLIDRLASGTAEPKEGLIVPLRRIQGRVKRSFSAILSKLH